MCVDRTWNLHYTDQMNPTQEAQATNPPTMPFDHPRAFIGAIRLGTIRAFPRELPNGGGGGRFCP